MLAQILLDYQPYLPVFLIAAVALAILTVILLVVFSRKLLAQSRARQALARPPAAQDSLKDRLWKTDGYWGRFQVWRKNLFARWGWGVNDDLSLSFKKNINVLKTYLPGRAPEYDLPWFMMVGPHNSGKTDILKDVYLELPIGQPISREESDLVGVSWAFYDQGIMLDVGGEYFLNELDQSSDDEAWTRLLRLLNRYRVKRPLDGLILTLPVSEIYGPHRLSQSALMDRARHVYAKLWKLQSVTGMRIPIYVIVTKCDEIPGFHSLVCETPRESHEEIFGWSSPYATDATYGAEWIEDIFAQLHRSINRLRSAVFTQGFVRDERDGVFLFPMEFMTIKEALGSYLSSIFKQSSYHDSFFLRGVYFTGKATINGAAQFTEKGVFSDVKNRLEENSVSRVIREKSVFLRDLFEKKIFCEFALAHPIRRVLLSTSRLLNFMKLATVVAGVGWGIGIVHDYQDLQKGNQTLVLPLNRIFNALQGITQQGGYNDTPHFSNYLSEQAELILDGFTRLEPVGSFCLFIPASWISSLDARIREAFTIGYDHVVIPSLYATLLKKVKDTVALGRVDAFEESKQNTLNPTSMVAFRVLSGYVKDIIDLERHVAIFNNIDERSSVQDLAELVKYLFHKELPKGFFENSQYYTQALVSVTDRDIDLFDFKVMAGQKLGALFRNFTQHAFDVTKSFPAFVLLKTDLSLFGSTSNAQRFDDQDVRKITQECITVADILSSGSLSWIETASFSPSPTYTDLMNNIAASVLLGNELSEEVTRVADQEFVKFKLSLAEFKSALTGSFFSIRESRLIAEPSQRLVSMIDALTAFLNEPFMKRDSARSLTIKIPPGKLLFWDPVLLLKAEEMIDIYNSYVGQRVTLVPMALQELFKLIGRNSARERVEDLIAQAQAFHDQPLNLSGFGAREALHAQVQNVSAAIPHFTKILGLFEVGNFVNKSSQLRELLVKQNYDILERIEKLLEIDNLYNAREEAFEWWDGAPMVGLKAFGVHSITDMQTYLTAQRFQVSFLAKEMAEPIITLLSLGYLEDVPYDLPLVTKWSHIASVLVDYDKQSPSNSLKILERFLAYDINELSLENCDLSNMDLGDFDGAGDYFIEVRNRYYRLLRNRCESLSGRKAIERYNRAASFFNVNLAGRFPFTKEAGTLSEFEADPSDVETFFQLFDALSPHDLKSLAQDSRFASAQDSVEVFVTKIESIRPLMLASLDQGMKKQIPRIALDVAFRTNRDEEIGGDKIIDWSVDFGHRKIDIRGTEPMTYWQVGAPVDIMLRWAADGDSLPVADPRNVALEVTGSKAVFSYRGRWSLIRLIRVHGTPESRLDVSKEPGPAILEFRVPTAYNKACYQGTPPLMMDRKSESARVYCQLNLHIPVTAQVDGEQGVSVKKVQTLAVPRFPYEAPVVDLVPLRDRRRN